MKNEILLQNELEALLFSSGKAMSEEQLALLTDESKSAVRKALKSLHKSYAERETALKLFNNADSWKIVVKEEYLALVRRIVADTELSKATLETLAVIAYHQPDVLQSKVVELRGSGAYDNVKELLELGFITKIRQGRSYKLKLTEKFFDYFEVEGEDSIRKVFTSLKKPKERQKQLGNLAVVDALPESKEEKKNREEKELLGDLEVVDEEDDDGSGSREESEDMVPEDENNIKDEKEEDNDFLKELEKKIDAISARNDERESDESLKPGVRDEESGESGEEIGGESDEEQDKIVDKEDETIDEKKIEQEDEEDNKEDETDNKYDTDNK